MPPATQQTQQCNPSKHSCTILYHTGHRWRRLQKFVDAVPLEGNVHSDAYRDIDTSFESESTCVCALVFCKAQLKTI